jgi:sugar/nucleoside kinase (ribokinase family)
MPPTFAIAGKLTREYLLPPTGSPRLDAPGGSLLYAAGGLAAWDSSIALMARVNDSYPPEWLDDLSAKGWDTAGIVNDPECGNADLREFIAYTETNERSQSNAVSHFAKRGLSFPKSLLGWQPPVEAKNPLREIQPLSPSALRAPKEYHPIRFVHLCPFDFTSQGQMVNLFKGGSDQALSLDPDPNYMKPTFWRDLRIVLGGITAFLPSEEEIRSLFWGETHDLWEMAKRVADHGPQVIVIKRGAQGQMLYDAASKRRFEIPAYPARLADPTGAGDAFSGGFLAGYERTRDPLLATLHGNISASLKVEGVGPLSVLDAMPGLAEARLQALQEMAREV